MGNSESKLVAWQPDNASAKCTHCDAPFSFTKRRHHCRFCGKLMCATCTGWAREDPRDDAMTLRSCEACFEAGQRQAGQPQAQPAAAPAAQQHEPAQQQPAQQQPAEAQAKPAEAEKPQEAAPAPSPAEQAKKMAFAQFVSAFVPFCEQTGGFNAAEAAAIFGAFGVSLKPEELEALGKRPAVGDKMVVPPQAWKAPATDELSPAPTGDSFTLKPDEGLEPRLAKSGVAAQTFKPLYGLLCDAAAKLGDQAALRVEEAGLPVEKAGSAWVSYSWAQYRDEAKRFGKALLATGFEAFQSVAICGFNHPCWFFAHCGAIAVNGLSAGTYTTNSSEACSFVAADSNARVIAVDTVANAKKYLAARARGELPNAAALVVWGVDAIPAELSAEAPEWVMTYADFVKRADGVEDAAFEERAAAVQVKNCSSLIYTSGTTGNPKGVMMSHDSIAFSAEATLNFLNYQSPELHIVSFLPMSHIAAQIVDIAIPMTMAARGVPSTIHCARADALKGTLGATLQAVRPTLFFAVPRVWEKFVEGIKAKAAAAASQDPQTVKQLKQFAARVGAQGSAARQTGGNGELPYGYAIAKSAVHDKVRAALGLDRCELCMTGAAPITKETLGFLSAMGIDILEVYGMSETAGMGTLSPARTFKFGSCGVPTFPMELKTEHVAGRDKEGEGEICFRGRHVMMGYLRNEAKTREVIDAEGWMHSGDVGRIDADGHVYITGRIKELIITAGGENIAPVPIETRLKALLPALSNVVMVGDKRKYNTMLVTLKAKPDLDTGAFHDELVAEAAAVNPEVKSVTAAREDATWREYIQKGLDAYNKEAVSNAQKIQKFTILPTDLSVPGGELTGTLKLKRSVTVEKYAAEIDAMYAE